MKRDHIHQIFVHDRRNYNKMIEMEESSHRDLENNDNYTRNQESVAAYMSSL